MMNICYSYFGKCPKGWLLSNCCLNDGLLIVDSNTCVLTVNA